MTESETMWEDEEPSPQLDMDVDLVDFQRQEMMLKRKVVFLEEFQRNGGLEPRSAEDRCQILQERIASVERALADTGKLDAAFRYIKHAPVSDFEGINRVEFMDWVVKTQTQQHHVSQVSRDLPNARKRTLEPESIDSSPGNRLLSLAPAASMSKRLRILDKERAPCLRCRILKKKCDTLQHCSHCPEQSFDSKDDYWKVLGCFRDTLRGLSLTFCPHFSRSTRRVMKHSDGRIEIINFLLTKSAVSANKRRRILHLVKSHSGFSQLANSLWDNVEELQSANIAAASSEMITYEDILPGQDCVDSEDYEAAWSILQAITMDSAYLNPTRYNFFELLRLGNKFSKAEPDSWELFRQAKRLLRQSVETYLLERLCASMSSDKMTRPPPFYPGNTPTTASLILIDIKNDMENFLSDFEICCSGRGKLTGMPQFACFYSLLIFGIAKSMLIDSYSIREQYEVENPWQSSDATGITSAYKVLVSCFCWSSKTDVLQQNVLGAQHDTISNAVNETRSMLRHTEWETLGYKGTKEFMLNLGSSSLVKGAYNGFLAQSFGLSGVYKKPPSLQHSPSQVVASRLDVSDRPTALQHGNGHTNISSGEIFNHLLIETNDQPPCQKSMEFTFSNNISGDSNSDSESRHRGGRRGALDPEASKRAREVRRLGSCWSCWSARMACSAEGTPCDRCKKTEGPETKSCLRTPFTLFAGSFFPDFISSQYTIESLETYIEQNVQSIMEEELEVEITWDSDFVAPLKVSRFIPVPGGKIQSTYSSRTGEPLAAESLSLCLLTTSTSAMEQICADRLESGLLYPGFSGFGFNHLSSDVVKTVMKPILQFYNRLKVKDPLIRELLLLYLALLTFGRPSSFKESSLDVILLDSQRKSSDTVLYSSRLINLQLKHGMYNLARQLAEKILSRMEKIFRNRDKALWPISFVAVTLLCICMDQLQVFTNNYVEAQRSVDAASGAELEQKLRDFSKELEDGPFAQITHIFHLRYRTHKKDTTGLNPFRSDFVDQEDARFDEPTRALIGDFNFFQILTGMEPLLLVANADFLGGKLQGSSNSSGDRGNSQGLDRANRGRLVSMFLLSFLRSGDSRSRVDSH